MKRIRRFLKGSFLVILCLYIVCCTNISTVKAENTNVGTAETGEETVLKAGGYEVITLNCNGISGKLKIVWEKLKHTVMYPKEIVVCIQDYDKIETVYGNMIPNSVKAIGDNPETKHENESLSEYSAKVKSEYTNKLLTAIVGKEEENLVEKLADVLFAVRNFMFVIGFFIVTKYFIKFLQFVRKLLYKVKIFPYRNLKKRCRKYLKSRVISDPIYEGVLMRILKDFQELEKPEKFLNTLSEVERERLKLLIEANRKLKIPSFPDIKKRTSKQTEKKTNGLTKKITVQQLAITDKKENPAKKETTKETATGEKKFK